MARIALLAIILLQVVIASSEEFQCPDGSQCPEPGTIEAQSFQFLKKLTPKQKTSVHQLIVMNATLDKVPVEIKYLKHMEYLDLSNNNIQISSIPSLPHLKTLKLANNNIKSLRLSLLPKNIRELDISNNLIGQIPDDWSYLQNLKIIHLQKNPIDCSCNDIFGGVTNIRKYTKLMENGVTFPEEVFCNTPKEFHDKSIKSIDCTDEFMINDQPFEGSGNGEDIFDVTSPKTAPLLPETEEGFEINEFVDDRAELPQEHIEEEGSGELEGSAFSPVDFHVPACRFNCATPEPVGRNDSKDDSASPPGATDQIKMFAEDILRPIVGVDESPEDVTLSSSSAVSITDLEDDKLEESPENDTHSSSSAVSITDLEDDKIEESPEDDTHSSSSAVSITDLEDDKIEESPEDDTHSSSSAISITDLEDDTVIEPTISKSTDTVTMNKNVGTVDIKEAEMEVGRTNESRTGEMKKTTAAIQNNYAVYVVVVCGLLLAVVLLVCLLKKRKAEGIKRRRRELSNGLGEEMKPLEKPSIREINEKNGKCVNANEQLKERIPLIGDQNGNVPHTKDITDAEFSDSADSLDSPEDINIREKSGDLLTPATERVTIRASEIPDSILKTPILIHRQKNSEGEIVSTVLPP